MATSMSLGCNAQMQKMSHIFISLNQIKSLRPSGSGQARCPSFLELSCPSMESGVEVGTENWGRNQTFSAQSPIFTIILSASRHGCAAGAGTLVGPWRGLPLVPTITTLLRASSFKGYSPSHPMEGHSSWAEHSSPQIVDPTKKTHLLLNLQESAPLQWPNSFIHPKAGHHLPPIMDLPNKLCISQCGPQKQYQYLYLVPLV